MWIGLFHIIWGVSKATHDNYHGLGENVIWQKKDINKFRGGDKVDNVPVHFLLIIQKTKTVQEHDQY